MFDSTPLMRGHAALRYFELGVASSACMQQSVLKGLAHHAASTRFGKDHGFAAIDTVRTFQKNVPLRRYEDFFREYLGPVFPRLVNCTSSGEVPYFALSSGTTTGKTKFIPCSKEMVFANWRGAHEIIVHHIMNRPWSLEGSHAETREVYSASEGFMATADRGDGEGLRLILDGGVFFEFVPVGEIESRRRLTSLAQRHSATTSTIALWALMTTTLLTAQRTSASNHRISLPLDEEARKARRAKQSASYHQ
jgi:hypothetical protein